MLKRLPRIIVMFFLVALWATPIYSQQLKTTLKFDDALSLKRTAKEAVIDFSITNISDLPLYILNYQTPLNGIERDLFSVQCDNQPVLYLGVVLLRMGPTNNSWIKLLPNQTITRKFDLSVVYDMRKKGDYTVRFRGFLDVLFAQKKEELPTIQYEDFEEIKDVVVSLPSEPEWVESNTILFPYSGTCIDPEGCGGAPVSIPFEAIVQKKSVSCSDENRSQLEEDQSSARFLVQTTYEFLFRHKNNNHYFKEWFGRYTTRRFQRVQRNFLTMNQSLKRSFRYNCGGRYCNDGVIAYVYPGIEEKIWVCDDYFRVEEKDKPGVIAFEAAHWDRVAGVDDFMEGRWNCQELSDSHPDLAIQNANNYRYAMNRKQFHEALAEEQDDEEGDDEEEEGDDEDDEDDEGHEDDEGEGYDDFYINLLEFF